MTAVAQAPVACACNVSYNRTSDSISGFGSVSTNASCSVEHPTPTTPQCVLTGTIDLYFIAPPTGYSVNVSFWGAPNTNFTPIENGHMTFDHPANTTVPCNGSAIGSFLLINATNGNPAQDIVLWIQKEWTCDID